MAEMARLKVTLQGIRPPIWRRLEVPTELTLAGLSDVLQAAFGWTNSHLHEFEVGERRIGTPDPDDYPPPRGRIEDDALVRLAEVLAAGTRSFAYVYDFGDWWKHQLVVEELGPAKAALTYPRCTAGRRAAPPEDCGGNWGYEHLVEVLADPGHAEHAELREWRPFFDPDEFDLAAADAAVRNPPAYWE